jgi:hypothetical protein
MKLNPLSLNNWTMRIIRGDDGTISALAEFQSQCDVGMEVTQRPERIQNYFSRLHFYKNIISYSQLPITGLAPKQLSCPAPHNRSARLHTHTAKTPFTGEELQVKFLSETEENSLKY